MTEKDPNREIETVHVCVHADARLPPETVEACLHELCALGLKYDRAILVTAMGILLRGCCTLTYQSLNLLGLHAAEQRNNVRGEIVNANVCELAQVAYDWYGIMGRALCYGAGFLIDNMPTLRARYPDPEDPIAS